MKLLKISATAKSARASLAHSPRTPHNRRGFSLIELMIVIALVGVVAGFGVVMSYSSIAKASVIQERDLLVSLLLSGARARAMANINEDSHGVRIDNTATPHKTYTLFEGTNYTANPGSYRTVNFSTDANRVTNNADDDVFDIIFKQRSGNIPAGPDSIKLTGNGKNITFDINEAGRIDW